MNSQEMWQVEVQGHIYEANIEEIIEWIGEGSVTPDDKIRKGSLRWLKAEKVPELYGYFFPELFENNLTFTANSTGADLLLSKPGNSVENLALIQSFLPQTVKESEPNTDSLDKEKFLENKDNKTAESPVSTNGCSVHPDSKAKYFCGTCLTLFCKNCPESFGGNVKICIDCGGMCQHYTGEESVIRSVGAINKPYPKSELSLNDLENPWQKIFSSGDFARALIYPFKFKTSLIFGAALFMIFSLGESIAGFGISMYFAAVVCFMLANTLVFGCLANTVDNFSQGKAKLNFMPSFDEFSIWDDVVQPLFLSLAVYSISFGLLIVLVTGAMQYASDSESKIEIEKQRIISTVLPNAENASNSVEQIPPLNQLAEQLKPNEKQSSENLASENALAHLQQNSAKQETTLQKLQQNIKRNVQAHLQLQLGKDSKTEDESFIQTFKTVMRLSLVYSVPVFLALLWGIFYFPVACAVAGYTRSFAAVLNPTVCFDTARRLGFDYFKLIGVFLILVAAAFGINAILQTIFAPLNLPMMGNLPVKAVVSVFVFYLSIVFSVSLGTALCRKSERLNFSRA